MKEFEHPNLTDFTCPICKSSKDLPVVLVGLPGTEDGWVIECEQVHSDCWKLFCRMNDIKCEIEGE